MFQFPALPSLWLCVHHRIPAHYHRGVPAFGYPWFVGCLHLPTAFRSLPRPSSAPSAKASSLCSFLLNLFSRLQLKLQYILPFSGFYIPLDISLLLSRNCVLDFIILFSFQGTSLFQGMVENKRIELLTPCVQGRCSPS